MPKFHLISTSLWIAAFVAGTTCGAVARADDAQVSIGRTASVAKINEEGSVLYKNHEYRRAVEKFIQAYAIDPDPNLLFNIARSYEALGDVVAAIEKYEAFLSKPGADLKGRQRAEEALRVLRAKIPPTPAGSQAATPSSKDPASKEAPPREPAQKEAAASADKTTERTGRVSLAWITLGTGVAFTTVGSIVYMLGAHDHSQVTDSPGYGQAGKVDPMTEAEARSLADSGDLKKKLGGLGVALGGALLATSVVLFLVIPPQGGASEKSTALRVLPEKGGAEVTLEARF